MDTVLRNVCWLSPPEPPIFDNTAEDAKKRMLNFRESCSAYQKYTKLCENGTVKVSPEPTSTLSPTTIVSRVTSSPVLTTEFTNITSQQNDTIIRTKPTLFDLTPDSGSNALIPVLIPLIIILLLAATVVAVWYIKKRKGRTVPLYNLQNHDSVNYLNNKAEVGEKWGGAQENVNYQNNTADKLQNWKGNETNGTELDSKNLHKSHNESPNVTKSHKNHEHRKNVKNNIELGEYTKNGHFEEKTSNPAATQRRQHKCDDEVIYANSQFEKVAKASNKKAPVQKVPSIRDATPPADVKTQDMYYIDENPYDRVDRREKPVPKKRNKVT
uniref:Uncharacterized protein n=2 Tax=Magallana gigas TaxID=29159 RepID=A0A8W8IGA5_MAGGI|nr:uncharacterized protein LOC105318535 isoform X11 [Crassostrea gigas]